MSKQLHLHGIGGSIQGLVVDLFAGGGGASTGIEQAIGRAVDLAINHDPAAIHMHEQNHPGTEHRCESIFDVDPVQATRGEPVAVLWASPSCTHFSRARGGTPVSKQPRGLGWMVLRWAGKVRPATIVCENVAEWETWGPVRRGQPWKRRKGAHWRLFLASLERLGYTVEHRVLNAADYGAPTNRRRLFLVARADGAPVWPAPTHGPKRALPYRTAADCIDWSDLGTSIFERKRPLAPATCRRIAAGIVRYVLEGKPFLVQTWYGERAGQAPRVMPVEAPLGTVVAGGAKAALCSPHLVEIGQRHGRGDAPVDQPAGTIMPTQRHALVSAFLSKYFSPRHEGEHHCKPLDQPMATMTAKDHHSLIACHLTKFQENGHGTAMDAPVPTVMAGAARFGLCAAHLTTLRGTTPAHVHGDGVEDPLRTISAGGQHHALCAAFLTTYYSGVSHASRPDQPVPTIVTKARHGLVAVEIDGTTYALADIRLRMLKPRELAKAQGFPDGYVLTGTQAEQIGRIGNSVCPPVAAALVRANLPAVRRATA